MKEFGIKTKQIVHTPKPIRDTINSNLKSSKFRLIRIISYETIRKNHFFWIFSTIKI